VVALTLAGLGLMAGCTGPGADQAGQAAVRFAEQASTSPEQACDLLSDQTRKDLERNEQAACGEALGKVDLPSPSAQRSVDVYEQHARVALAGDVMFLARFDDGWKVTAAGCKPQPDDEPYDCELGG
jgi:hypothetical protein